MKGEAQPLLKFFDGSDKRFVIPLYQRNYDWKEENCEQLYRDLIKLTATESGKTHFFGSIVSSCPQGSQDHYIIDGQQRITTISLLLVALFNAAKSGEMKADDPILVRKIYDRYLVDEYQKDERKVRLKPIKKDMEAFDALLYKNKDKYIEASNVTHNYQFLYDKIRHSGLTVDQIFDAINRLEVIIISLEADDDPQLIFESLNSTGLDLSEADKIRNYMLMSLTPSEQDDLYTRYWNPIEEYTTYNSSPFVRDYLTMKQGKICRIDKVYVSFKAYAEEACKSKEELLADMHHYAGLYAQIATATLGSKRLSEKMRLFKTLDTTVVYPFYMAFLDHAARTGMSEEEMYGVMDVVEAYWARRIICDCSSNLYNKLFATLHRDVLNGIDKSATTEHPSYLSTLTYILLRKGEKAAFPTDDEVKAGFATRQIYKMPTAARMFILERLENRDNRERHDVVTELATKNISIEHIMPQKLSPEWKKALGDEWERIHQQYLHTMANLTLTGYNSQYSNLPFAEKRDMEKGFKDSAFRLNNYVKTCTQWTENELQARQKELLGEFMKLYPMPATSFMPAERETTSISLDDEDVDFTNKYIRAYTLYSKRYDTSNWATMLVNVCKQIAQERHDTVLRLCEREKNYFSQKPDWFRSKFAPGMYVRTNNNTNSKIDVLRALFEECDIPATALEFELLPDSTDED